MGKCTERCKEISHLGRLDIPTKCIVRMAYQILINRCLLLVYFTPRPVTKLPFLT